MENTLQYAGFWKRFAAYMIDFLILSFFQYQLYYNVSLQLQIALNSNENGYSGLAIDNPAVIIITAVLSFFISWSYFSGLESSPLQATIGKLAAGIYVTDINGVRLSFGKASCRYFGKIISGLIICIGFIMAGFTNKKQALHDIMAGCLVLAK